MLLLYEFMNAVQRLSCCNLGGQTAFKIMSLMPAVRECHAVIPPFHSAVDRAISYLDPVHGLLGVADFYVPSKYDLPLRQMSWLRRFFWRCASGLSMSPECQSIAGDSVPINILA